MRETDRVEDVVERDGYLDSDGRVIRADWPRGGVVVTKEELLELVFARPVAGELKLRCRQRSDNTDTPAVTSPAARQHLYFTDTLQKITPSARTLSSESKYCSCIWRRCQSGRGVSRSVAPLREKIVYDLLSVTMAYH